MAIIRHCRHNSWKGCGTEQLRQVVCVSEGRPPKPRSDPKEFNKVGYYESWSINWPCMNGGIYSVEFSDYTHVHFAFADLRGGNIWMDDAATSEFEEFKGMSNFKKILSIGGWEYSTNVTMHNNIRRSIDPGVPTGEGIPPGEKDDGKNYLEFVKKLKGAIGGKSGSICS